VLRGLIRQGCESKKKKKKNQHKNTQKTKKKKKKKTNPQQKKTKKKKKKNYENLKAGLYSNVWIPKIQVVSRKRGKAHNGKNYLWESLLLHGQRTFRRSHRLDERNAPGGTRHTRLAKVAGKNTPLLLSMTAIWRNTPSEVKSEVHFNSRGTTRTGMGQRRSLQLPEMQTNVRKSD